MANYLILKSAIIRTIKNNGLNEISGDLLQQQLLSIINSFGVGYQFMGVASSDTIPGTPDQKECYLAGPGTYPGFDNLVVPENKIVLLIYRDAWEASTIFDALDKDVLISEDEYDALVEAGEVDPNKIYYVYDEEEVV